MRELVEIYERFKIRRIFFQDDEFTLNKKWVSRFCDELGKVKMDFKWVCLSRVDFVDEEILLKMRRAGCYRINFGVESGNDAILTTIRKKVSVSQVVRVFDLAAKMGIERQAYFMIGNIGENIQTVADTIRLAKKINPEHIFFSIASPLPGTDFYQLAKSENLIVTDNWGELDYYGDHVAIKTKELSSSDILQLQKIAFAEFFARRRYLNENIIRRIFDKAFLDNYGRRELIHAFSRFLLAYPRKFHYRKVWYELYKKLSNHLD